MKNPTSSNAQFMGLALRLPESNLMVEVLSNMGVQLRNSLHDGIDEHQVADIREGYLEFYTREQVSLSPTLMVEVGSLEDGLSRLPSGFEIIYQKETDLEQYRVVALCKYPVGLEVKIYERTI